MYKVLLATSRQNTKNMFSELRFHGGNAPYSIAAVCKNGNEALQRLSVESFKMVIIDSQLSDMTGVQLLRLIKAKEPSVYVVLYSMLPDFEFARQGIIFGAFDYLTGVPDKISLKKMFVRIENETVLSESKLICEAERIIDELVPSIRSTEDYTDGTELPGMTIDHTQGISENISNMYAETVEKLYTENPWFEMYFSKNEFLNGSSVTQDNYINRLSRLSDEFRSLYLETEDPQLKSVITYIISNPDGDLRLKTVADRFFIYNTYLSTLFNTKYGMHYADYLSQLKIKRLRYLLVHTDDSIGNIIKSLGRSQPGYFSKLFKEFYGQPPIEYRNQHTPPVSE